jgi:Na+/glutamate symporter
MPLISGAQGAVSGAGSGMAIGTTGAIVGGVVGFGLGLASGISGQNRQRRVEGDLRKLEGLQDELIEEQLSMDAFQRQRQAQVVTRNTAIAQSRIRAASIASGAGLGSVAQHAASDIAGQAITAREDIGRGRDATESQLDIQRRIAQRQAKLQSR